MAISSIGTDAEYRDILKEIEGLMSAAANTAEGKILDALVTLVEGYERVHFPMGSSNTEFLK